MKNSKMHVILTLNFITATIMLPSNLSDTGSKLNPGRCLAFYNDTTQPITLRLTVYNPLSFTAGTQIHALAEAEPHAEPLLLTLSPHQTVSVNVGAKIPEKPNDPQISPYIADIAIQTNQGFTDLPRRDIQKLNAYFGKKLNDVAGCKENKQRQDVAISILYIPDIQMDLIREARGLTDMSLLASFGNDYHLLIPDPSGFTRPRKQKIKKASPLSSVKPRETDLAPETKPKPLFVTTPSAAPAKLKTAAEPTKTATKPSTTKPTQKQSTLKPTKAGNQKPKTTRPQRKKSSPPKIIARPITIKIRPRYRVGTPRKRGPSVPKKKQGSTQPSIQIEPMKQTSPKPRRDKPSIPAAAKASTEQKPVVGKKPTFEEQLQEAKKKLQPVLRPDEGTVVDLQPTIPPAAPPKDKSSVDLHPDIMPSTPIQDKTSIDLHPAIPPAAPSKDKGSVDLHPGTPLASPSGSITADLHAATKSSSADKAKLRQILSPEEQLQEAKRKLRPVLRPNEGTVVDLHSTITSAAPFKDKSSVNLHPGTIAPTQGDVSIDLYPAATVEDKTSVELHSGIPPASPATTQSPSADKAKLRQALSPEKQLQAAKNKLRPVSRPNEGTVVDLHSTITPAASFKDKSSVNLHPGTIAPTQSDVSINLYPAAIAEDKTSVELHSGIPSAAPATTQSPSEDKAKLRQALSPAIELHPSDAFEKDELFIELHQSD